MGYKKTSNARPIINITISEELLEEAENFRFEERKKIVLKPSATYLN